MNDFHFESIILPFIFILYSFSLKCDLVFDDTAAITTNQNVISNKPLIDIFKNDFWGTPMYKEESHGSYRPITTLSFRLNHYFHKLDPMGYHLVNLILHLAVTKSFQKFSRLFLSEKASVLSSIIFGCHPVHVEAVTGVVGRAELFSALIFLGTFITFNEELQRNVSYFKDPKLLLKYFLLIFIGTLCKEQCITIIGVCMAYEVMKNYFSIDGNISQIAFKCIPRSFCFLSILVSIIYFRISIMSTKLPSFSEFSNPAAYCKNPLTRWLTYSYLWALNFYFVSIPTSYCCDWSMGSIPLVESTFDQRNLWTIAFFSMTGFLIWKTIKMTDKKVATTLGLSLILHFIPFIPSSNMFFPVGFVLAERVLYIPSFGFCLLMGLSLDLMENYFKYLDKIFKFFIILLVGVYSFKTFNRVHDWENEYSLYKSGVDVNPKNAKMWNNLGHVFEGRGNQYLEEALSHYTKAVEIQPNDVGAHINVARVHVKLNKIHLAKDAYKLAIDLMPKPKKNQVYFTRVEPKQLQAFVEYAGLLIEHSNSTQDHNEGENLLKRVLTFRKNNPAAYKKLGLLYHLRGDLDMALDQFKEAVKSDPNDADAYYNVGVVLTEKNISLDESIDYFKKALNIQPSHQHALLALARVLSKSSDTSHLREAYRINSQLILLDHYDKEQILFSQAMISTDLHDYFQAYKDYIDLLLVNQHHIGGLFNLALLLVNELSRPLEAIPYLEKLISRRDDHIKSYILLSDLYMTHLDRIEDAERLLKSGLEFFPDNIQARHNLCVVYAKRANYKTAADCFEELVRLSPNDQHIKDNYKYVISKLNV